jgi:hypothetical protein
MDKKSYLWDNTKDTTDIYEAMCASLYAYHFGAIEFLELIKHFEETLRLQPQSQSKEAQVTSVSAFQDSS